MTVRRLALYGLLAVIPLATSGREMPEETRIACMGNSITFGEGQGYPARLQSMLGDSFKVKNFGRNGATLLRKGDLPYMDQQEFRDALQFLPHVALIELGTNDSKPWNRTHLQDFERDYRQLIDILRRLPSSPRIVLVLPPPVFSDDSTGITNAVIRDRILPAIRSVAYATGCEVVNLYNHFLDRSALFPDRIHPSGAGAEVMAQRLRDAVKLQEDRTFDLITSARIVGDRSNYNGFECVDFSFQGRDAKVVAPHRTAKGRPWLWRARFWGHEPQTEIALLERGFHVVYCDVAELFGNDEAIGVWDRFYTMLTTAGLSRKSAFIGFSRGGVYMYRWAAKYPDRVACVYADAPVLDLKSWPGGKGKGHGNPEEWERFKKDFGLGTEEEALAFKGNPLDLSEQIARGGFPMLHVCGDADVTVPIDENTDPFEKKILQYGGSIRVIRKPGVGHHPHSLSNPEPIVEFILHATGQWQDDEP